MGSDPVTVVASSVKFVVDKVVLGEVVPIVIQVFPVSIILSVLCAFSFGCH